MQNYWNFKQLYVNMTSFKSQTLLQLMQKKRCPKTTFLIVTLWLSIIRHLLSSLKSNHICLFFLAFQCRHKIEQTNIKASWPYRNSPACDDNDDNNSYTMATLHFASVKVTMLYRVIYKDGDFLTYCT